MSPTPEEVEALRARAERLRGQVERATGAFHKITEDFGRLEVTAVSADRLVTATVGAEGRLRRLVLDPAIYRQSDADHLARTIEETIEVAVNGAQDRVRTVLKDYVPEELIDAHLNRDADGIIGGFTDQLRER
ncbi:hypothetical protein GCM10027280_41700 [Micromonospora polyrhachis]|uniref:DNA-binding protein YbaB n=1 Tax=Micromonospora polyrhachis TaxID=1282883 RepID=A0A7W7SLS4_9ACTN|nr:YbaB/EbfC family nucleoid-associated protein [Micromonospora polyrhachis]MBB4957133.1 DNA-binding protein YbaB [Micromonospora polyrhachis]